MTYTTYSFGFGDAEGDGSQKDLLGGKGANLAAMSKLGLPIPAGLTIPTSYCADYQKYDAHERQMLCNGLAQHAIKRLQDMFGEGPLPLLSVRSGARVSMPGMMDTILNVGITSETLSHWREKIGDRAALDSYRRLIQMYGSTVNGIDHDAFEALLAEAREKAGVEEDFQLEVNDLMHLLVKYENLYFDSTGQKFPDTLEGQLAGCIGAVFGSWMNERAIEYRIANKIPHEWGTAVTVQQMVFGNAGDKSATGVLFTRNPNTGEPGLYGEFLVNAQGEDVVAGIRTPETIQKMKDWNAEVYDVVEHWAFFMEAEHRDMQDMEFTVEEGAVYFLQTRSGKRSAQAAFKIAHDLMQDGVITKEEALKRVTGKQYVALKRPTIPASFAVPPTVKGLPAAGSVVTGVAVFSAEKAKQSKVPCVLVAEETTPDDFGGMMASVGILTRTGGATSHAAVVARGMDKCCVVGASDLQIGKTIKEGDMVTLDGATGRVWVGVEVPVQAGGLTPEAKALVELATGGKSSNARIVIDKDSWASQIPQSGHVVLDMTALVANPEGHRILPALFSVLAKNPNLSGVLDFEPESGTFFPEDSTMLDTLGLATVGTSATTHFAEPERVRLKMCAKGLPAKVLKRWFVNVSHGVVRKGCEARGWSMVREVNSLGDLIEGNLMFRPSATLQTALAGQGVSLQQVLDLLAAAGKPASVLPETVDEDTMMFQLLGK